MTKKNKICIVLINVALGLFAAYTCLLCIRETHITKTQDTIVCNITKLYQKSGRSHHPKAYIVYRNKKYVSDINLGDSLRTGYNTTTFYYDEMLDRVFCRCFPKVLKKPIQLFLLRSHLFLVRRLKKKLNHRLRLFLSLFLFSSSGCGAIFPSTPMSPCKNSLSRIEDSSSSLCCFSQTEGGITPIVRFINFTFFSKKGCAIVA